MTQISLLFWSDICIQRICLIKYRVRFRASSKTYCDNALCLERIFVNTEHTLAVTGEIPVEGRWEYSRLRACTIE